MLAVILGARRFDRSPQLLSGRFFVNSAADVEEYMTDAKGMQLPRENVRSWFDDTRSASDQLEEIKDFLSERKRELKRAGGEPTDLFIYYVGHGLFTRGRDQAYCLAMRNTREGNEGPTSMRVGDLANVIKEHAAFMRRYLILDCCFAGSAALEFQSGALTAARKQIEREIPGRGTALMCAANADQPARSPEGRQRTMFSEALIYALRSGHSALGPELSFSELVDIVRDYLRDTFQDEYVRPEVHSPDQSVGDISHFPLFPNPAYDRNAGRIVGVRPVQADRAMATKKVRVAAPVPEPQRATNEAGSGERRHDRHSTRKQNGPICVSDAKTGTPSIQPKAQAASKTVTTLSVRQKAKEERKGRLADLEREKERQLAAQEEARRLFEEWRKLERAKELDRKKRGRQKAEKSQAQKTVEGKRERKERLSAEDVSPNRVLEQVSRRRAQAAAQSRPGARTDRRESQAVAGDRPMHSNRVRPQSEAARAREKALRAAQNAAADRELNRIRLERRQVAELRRLEKEKPLQTWWTRLLNGPQ
jgi:hypothetical protein